MLPSVEIDRAISILLTGDAMYESRAWGDDGSASRRCGAPRHPLLQPEPVDPALLYRVLDSARFAPSGGNRQGWRVVVVLDAERRRAISELYRRVWAPYRAQIGRASDGEHADASGRTEPRGGRSLRRRICPRSRFTCSCGVDLDGAAGHRSTLDRRQHRRRGVGLSVCAQHSARGAALKGSGRRSRRCSVRASRRSRHVLRSQMATPSRH